MSHSVPPVLVLQLMFQVRPLEALSHASSWQKRGSARPSIEAFLPGKPARLGGTKAGRSWNLRASGNQLGACSVDDLGLRGDLLCPHACTCPSPGKWAEGQARVPAVTKWPPTALWHRQGEEALAPGLQVVPGDSEVLPPPLAMQLVVS